MSQYPLCDCARANKIAVEVICVTFGNMETVFSFHFMLLSDDGAEAESTIVGHEGEAKLEYSSIEQRVQTTYHGHRSSSHLCA